MIGQTVRYIFLAKAETWSDWWTACAKKPACCAKTDEKKEKDKEKNEEKKEKSVEVLEVIFNNSRNMLEQF